MLKTLELKRKDLKLLDVREIILKFLKVKERS